MKVIPISWIINPPHVGMNLDRIEYECLHDMLKTGEYTPFNVYQIASETFALLGGFDKYAIACAMGLREVKVKVRGKYRMKKELKQWWW